jgi:SAM-dependent methyltransferase
MACGGRFVPREESIFEALHANEGSSYAFHQDLADQAKACFNRKDAEGLKSILTRVPKNDYLIRTVGSVPLPAALLEVGCSKGYLTAYFLLRGYKVLGVDIAPTAIATASDAFGPHFILATPENMRSKAPYAAIYHAGTIGCVDDPVAFTKELLDLLAPGGRLVFNAPNAKGCQQRDVPWPDTVPPDLVTLFTKDFWKTFEDPGLNVQVTEQTIPLKQHLRDLMRGRQPADTNAASPTANDSGAVAKQGGLVKHLGRMLDVVQSIWPFALPLDDYGIFVMMEKTPGEAGY